MDWLMGRSKKKDKEASNNGVNTSEDMCKLKISEEDVYDHLVEKNIQPLTSLPSEIDCNEWLASNTLAFFENLNTLYACLSEVCTTSTCPSMSGPGNIQYLWVDEKGRQIKYSSPQYIDCVMTNIYKYTQDETIFPTKYGNVFPANFDSTIRRINRLLSHVFVHTLHRHAGDLRNYQLSPHFNTLLYHFLLFVKRFQLVPDPEISVFDEVLTQFDRAYDKRTSKILAEATLGSSSNWVATKSDENGFTCDNPQKASDRTSLTKSQTSLNKKLQEGGKDMKKKQSRMSDFMYRYQDISPLSSCV